MSRRLFAREWLPLWAIVGVGAVLRFATIAHSSIWHDEGYTLFLIDRSPAEIVDATIRDVHPPLHYLLLHYWVMVFGHSEIAVRGLSAVFGLGTIFLAYGIMRRLIGREAGLLAALFVSLSPFLVRYSQEARMYGQVAFFATLATYALVRVLPRRTASVEPEPPGFRRWGWWALYVGGLSAAVYTQYYGLLVVLGHGLYVGLRFIWPEAKTKSREHWEELGSFILALVATALSFLPWTPILLEQAGRVGSGYWIQQSWMTVHTIPSSIYAFMIFDHLDGFHLRGYLHEIPLLAMAAVTAWSIWRFRSRWREVAFIIGLFLLPMLVIFTYSKLRTPVYQDRYFPFAAVGFYLLLALWARTPKSRWLKLASALALSGLLLIGNLVVYTDVHHRMREAAAIVEQGYRSGDEIVSLDLYTYFDFSYYNHTHHPALLYYRGALTYDEPGLLQGHEELRVEELGRLHPASHRLWAVGKPGRHGYYDDIPASWQLLERADRGSVEIRLYEVP